MQHNTYWAFLFFAGLSFFSFSQETLTKEAAIAFMLENNFGIQQANNNMAIAENNKSVLNADYLPSITGNAGASYDQTDTTTDFNGALDDQGNPRPDIVINDAETRRYNASIDLDYTLFDGFGRKYNYKTLKEQYNLSQLDARETIESTTVQLLSVYYEVARLRENVTVLETALQISKDRELRASYKFDYGQANKLEVLNAQVDITTDSINLLNTQVQLRNAKRDLNVVMNEALEKKYEVDTTIAFISPLLVESFLEKVDANNVSILQAEQNLLISDYQIKTARSLLLPTVGLTGSYGWNRNENPASAFFPGTTAKSNSLTLGANLRWNLFDGGTAITAVKNAKIFYKNQELLKEQMKQQVYRDIANAKDNYYNTLAIYKMQTQNVTTNQDNFERSQERLKLGQITTVEFRQAQLNLLNAQTNLNAAKYQAKLAEAQILQLSGQLLNVDY